MAGRASAEALSGCAPPVPVQLVRARPTMLLLRASPAAAAVPVSSFSAAPTPAYATTRPSFSTTARCSVGNLSPVRFEPLRADADPDPPSQDVVAVGTGAATVDEDEHGQQNKNHDDEEKDRDKVNKQEGISGISVPRQRYIAVPKAALLDALLSLFPSQPPTTTAAADDFRRFARPVLSRKPLHDGMVKLLAAW